VAAKKESSTMKGLEKSQRDRETTQETGFGVRGGGGQGGKKKMSMILGVHLDLGKPKRHILRSEKNNKTEEGKTIRDSGNSFL